jgi:uncharacterized protein
MSAFATVCSFGALALGDHRRLTSMGLLLTVAIIWSLVASLVVLPSVLALLGDREARDRHRHQARSERIHLPEGAASLSGEAS